MSKRFFIIIVFLSLVLILGRGLILPKYQKLRFFEQEIEKKRAEIEGREEHLQELNKMAEILKDYQDQLAKIDSALPSNPDLEVLLNFLQKTSSQSGLILKEINPPVSRPSSEEGLKETELSFAVSGAYTSFKNFLSVLEKSARFIKLETISFSSPGKEGFSDFNLKIKVYSY
jgi:Tfp pilus assembly protein PilO